MSSKRSARQLRQIYSDPDDSDREPLLESPVERRQDTRPSHDEKVTQEAISNSGADHTSASSDSSSPHTSDYDADSESSTPLQSPLPWGRSRRETGYHQRNPNKGIAGRLRERRQTRSISPIVLDQPGPSDRKGKGRASEPSPSRGPRPVQPSYPQDHGDRQNDEMAIPLPARDNSQSQSPTTKAHDFWETQRHSRPSWEG